MRTAMLCLLLSGCTGDGVVNTDGTDTEPSSGDTEQDTETDTGEPSADDTGVQPSATVGSLTVVVDEGACADGLYLSMTRVVYEGSYFAYEEQFSVPFTDCSATISTTAILPDDGEMTEVASALDDLQWAIYLPAIFTAADASIELPIEQSPIHDLGDSKDTAAEQDDVGALSGGLAYVGISDVLPTYVEGELNSIAQSMGLSTGWQLFAHEPGKTSFNLMDESDDDVISVTDTAITFAMSTNLSPADSNTITIGGVETGRADGESYSVGLLPYRWAESDASATAYAELYFAADGTEDWLLQVNGNPDEDHYIPAAQVLVDDEFDSCCQKDIPVAVEIPVVYTDENGDGLYTYGEEVLGGLCKDDYMVILLQQPPPTHLWAAEWYHAQGSLPGWTGRYGSDSKWWKSLNAEDYQLLNLEGDCQISDSWIPSE